MQASITISQLEQFRKDFAANKAYGVAMRAVVSAGVNKVRSRAADAGCLRRSIPCVFRS